MAVGKNKVSRGIRVLVDDSGSTERDLSGDLVPDSITGIGEVFEPAEMTGESHTQRHHQANHSTAEFGMQFHMNDAADTGAFTVLKGINGGAADKVTVQYGASGAAPTSGDPEYEGNAVLTSMVAAINNGAIVLDCTFVPGDSTGMVWGTVT